MTGNAIPLQPPANPLSLRAGPLSLLYDSGILRSISQHDIELVRRIYMALRDEFWNTIPGAMTNLTIEKHDRGFSIGFDSRHTRGPIDFIWHCTIEGRENGELIYGMDGEALSSFPHNRIGLCVLHPLATCKALACRIETIDGKIIESAFPEAIAPFQIFTDIRSMRYAPPLVGAIRIEFEGDAFETEDQRNWTDATFKTYAPPLPAQPRTGLEKGGKIHQRVLLTVEAPSSVQVAVKRAMPLRLDFQPSPPAGCLPSIGLTAPANDPSPRAVSLARAAGFSHLRADLRFDRDDIEAQALRARQWAATFAVPLEAALHFTDHSVSEPSRLTELLGASQTTICRFLVYYATKRATPASILASTAALRTAFSSTTLVTGTDGYFVEINRSRPDSRFADGVSFAATPQVHTFDDIALMENLPGLLETLRSCRLLFPERKLHISPLTMRPRRNPLLPEKDGGPDPRQQTLFAAAWMVGCVAYCLEGGASSLTFGEASGPGGLIAADGSRAFPALLPFSWLASFGGAPARCRLSNDPGQIIGLEFRHDGRFTGIIANLSGEAKTVTVGGLPPGCGVAVLDQAAYDAICRSENPAQDLPVTEIAIRGDGAALELGPYAVARFSEGTDR